MDSAIDRWSGEMSFAGAADVFRRHFPHTAPGYTTRRYSSIEAGRLIDRHYTCLTKAVAARWIRAERTASGDYRFSLADIAEYLLHENCRGSRRPWSAAEIELLKSGINPAGRSANACAVKRSKLRNTQ